MAVKDFKLTEGITISSGRYRYMTHADSLDLVDDPARPACVDAERRHGCGAAPRIDLYRCFVGRERPMFPRTSCNREKAVWIDEVTSVG